MSPPEYPMHFEASHEWQSDTFPIEANLFVDTILATILAHPSCTTRSILLSSFSPEICILLALKQDMFPVFFLNDSGNFPTGDVRASSLQEAVRFALRWGLDGIGMSSEPFVFAPRLVSVARARGLVTSSYGALNNEPESAQVSNDVGKVGCVEAWLTKADPSQCWPGHHHCGCCPTNLGGPAQCISYKEFNFQWLYFQGINKGAPKWAPINLFVCQECLARGRVTCDRDSQLETAFQGTTARI